MKMLFHAAPTPLRFLRHGRYGGGPCLSSLLRSLGRNGRRGVISCIGRGTSYHSTLVEVPEFESDIPFDDTKATAKDNALRTAVSQLACEFGRESMLSLQRFFGSRHASVIPTGSLKLDQALGIGGLPKGRIVEIYGREASGKTTLALHIIKEAQKFGGYCAYFDVENAMDPSLAKSMGVNTDNLLISRPDSAENLLSVVNTLVKSGSVDVIVVDSVAALVPQCEIDALIGGTHRDVQSRVMTQALRKIHQSLGYSQTLLVFLNQVRSSGNQGEGLRHMEEVTCGGNALKFYAAVRLRMMRMGLIKTEEEVTGLGVSVQVVKNKMGPAMKKVEMGIKFGKGFSSESEVLEMACDYGIIVKQGSNYFLDGYAFSDKHEAEQYLAKHDDILDEIVMILRNQLFQTDS